MPLEIKLSMTSPTLRCDFENYVDPLAHPAIKKQRNSISVKCVFQEEGGNDPEMVRVSSFIMVSMV